MANARAQLLRGWLDEAGLSIDALRSRLLPEHFEDRRVPSRTTVAARLSGVALDDAFVEAVADACSDDATEMGRLLARDRALRDTAVDAATPADTIGIVGDSSTSRPGDLIAVQQKYIATQERLVQAVERAAALERERSGTHQLVLVLLSLVDKLHRDIDDLSTEAMDTSADLAPTRTLQQIRAELSRSEQQRQTAEKELERARSERRRADRLAREAAEQVRTLQAEIDKLRGNAAPAEAESHLVAPVPIQQDNNTFEAAAADIDTALVKAARHLDEKAEQLDHLAGELHQDNPLDISLTSNDTPDNSQMSEPDAVDLTPEQVVDKVQALLTEDGADDTAQGLLHLAGRSLPATEVLRGAIMLRDINLPDAATQLLDAAIGRTRPVEMPALISALRARGQDAELYQLLNQLARQWSASGLTEVVTSLRKEAQDSDAYQVLSAAGRDCPPLEVLELLERVAVYDADWVVDAACRDRPLNELPSLEEALRNVRKADAGKVASAYELRKRAASREPSIAPGPRPTSLLVDNYEENGEYPLVRPYSIAGGNPRRPHRTLPNEAVVRTTASPDQIRGLLTEHQRICNLCRDPYDVDVTTIADRLSIPLGVTRILVADLAESGLVQIHVPAADSHADDDTDQRAGR
ncbi:DUF742 domain-containing protein [Streptomyces antnestii]|nr:DUF742 domain-containing protein [Streptomyces sp. San01]